MSVMVTDPIADMLTRIRNANQQRHAEVVIPHSRLKVELAEILKNEGFVSGYKVEGEGIRYEIAEFLRLIRTGELNYVINKEMSQIISAVMEQYINEPLSVKRI